ncbi:MAG: choice-of-anchor L domain-containing protein [Saprospiraceae bacterium]|nr:choice-of-anchor L domain-containing protein [Saprospiraceae bacterium]MDW8483674.1 choice-of-anchor L domain-containing protein [Saprospiraceae bacterium]
MECVLLSGKVCTWMFGAVVLMLALSGGAQTQSMQVTSAATSPFTPTNLISNVFLGNGIEVLSISYSGKATSVGYFTGGLQAVGLERGIVMTTGLAETINPTAGPFGADQVGSVFATNNLSGLVPGTDPDLSPISSGALYDITAYTIRFIPTADTLRFRYCFASEEYPEFACSDYNDIFGFFISGPGYPKPTNIARIPGTSLPVAINNIHPGNPTANRPCPPRNAQLYINNLNSNKQPTYDGLTGVFTAEAVVVPCDTYVIRLVIADVGDPVYDSGVFLEAKSFGTGAVRTTLVSPNLDGVLVEGCAPAILTFRLPEPSATDVSLDYRIFGTALNGVDITPIPSHAVIPAGQREVVLPIQALKDSLNEGDEWLALDIRRDPCHRDTFFLYIRENTLAPPSLPKDTLFCKDGNMSITLNGTLPIPVPQPPFFENTQPLQIHPVNTPVTSSLTVFGVSPPTVQPGTIRSICLTLKHGWVDDIDAYIISPGGQVLELMTDCGANGKNFTQTCFTPTASRSITSATASEAPFTGEWQPEGPWSDLWGSPINGTWRLVLKDDQNGFIGTLQHWSITFEPSYKIQYLWTPATQVSCSTCPVTNVVPTDTVTYRVVATDSYGCTVEDSITVNTATPLPAPKVNCGSYSPSSITFTWEEIAGAIGYLVSVGGAGWSPANGILEHTVSGLSPGTTVSLQVQAVGATPCPASVATAVCSNCEQPVVTAFVTDASCANAANGRVVLKPDGLNPPYSFALGTQTNQTGIFEQLAPGTYPARITDGSGCQRQLTITVGSPPPPMISLRKKDVSCFGGDDGSLRAEVSGGLPPYQFLWSDPKGQTQPSAVNLQAGIYTVTVTDRNGCTATATASVDSPTEIALFVTSIPARCHGEASGVATITATGGIGPYQYQWAGGQNSPVAVGLPAGIHGITVTDANGCAKATFALIVQPPPLTLAVEGIPPSCADRYDGAASAIAQGGLGSITYAWSTVPPQNAAKALKLGAGTYTVTISDQNSCTATASITLQAPPSLTVTLAVEDALCHGQPTGRVSASAQGGTGPLTYKWSTMPPQTMPSAINLPAGTYTVTVSDQNSCTAIASANVGQPPELNISFDILHVRCFGESTGSVSTHVTGGVPPYTYAWSSNDTTLSLVQKNAGIYTLTLRDANGCTATAVASIEQPPALQLDVQLQNIACYGQQTGRISLSPKGGTAPYTALWSGPKIHGDTSLVLDELGAGQYNLILSDANGCTLTQTFSLKQPDAPLKLTLVPELDTICSEKTTQLVMAAGMGGTPPYTYQWSTSGQTTSEVNLPAGIHTLTVSDQNGCTATATAQIVQQAPLSLVLSLDKVDCIRGGAAFVAGAAYGAIPADLNRLTFQWSTLPPQTGLRATQLAPGQLYTVTATDARGCTAVQSITIPPSLTIQPYIVHVQPPRCFDSADGQLVTSTLGGQPPYTYAWSHGTTTTEPVARNLRAGTYTVTVSDRAGCTGTVSATLQAPPILKARLQAEAAKCFGESTGALSSSGSGGIPPYQFSWSNGQTGPRATGLSAGTYTLTLTDANGCTLVEQAEVMQPAPLTGQASKKDILCFGSYTGEIVIVTEGGTPPYRYSLDGINWNGSPRQIGLPAGTYQPRVVDKNGCQTVLAPLTLEQRPPLKIALGPDTTLRPGQSVILEVLVTNAEPPLRYAWAVDDAPWLSCTDCPNPLVQGLTFPRWFTLQITDALGCVGIGRLLVNVEKQWTAYVPTAFSPNGDGVNDLLTVHGSPEARILSFEIYDRWGERVFSASNFSINDSNVGWDGTFRGQLLNSGVFVWVLQVEWPDGSQQTLYGQTLLTQ